MGHVPTSLLFQIVLVFLSNFVLASEGPRITHKVFLDMAIGEEEIGRIELGLYGEIVPKTVPPIPGLLSLM
jgi:peptidyl-prolyl cis-trans isomerase B (cyclophilin B)